MGEQLPKRHAGRYRVTWGVVFAAAVTPDSRASLSSCCCFSCTEIIPRHAAPVQSLKSVVGAVCSSTQRTVALPSAARRQPSVPLRHSQTSTRECVLERLRWLSRESAPPIQSDTRRSLFVAGNCSQTHSQKHAPRDTTEQCRSDSTYTPGLRAATETALAAAAPPAQRPHRRAAAAAAAERYQLMRLLSGGQWRGQAFDNPRQGRDGWETKTKSI